MGLQPLLSAALLKRRSEEAQAATLEFGKENSKRWLKVLNDYWLGNKKYLCGDQITIADYSLLS
jgi:glutathione S-transferase